MTSAFVELSEIHFCKTFIINIPIQRVSILLNIVVILITKLLTKKCVYIIFIIKIDQMQYCQTR